MNESNKQIIKGAERAILRFTHDKDQFLALMKEKPNFDTLCDIIRKIQTTDMKKESNKTIQLDLYEAILVGATLSIIRDELHTITIDADIQNIKAQTEEFN